jgi:hypothetical protein
MGDKCQNCARQQRDCVVQPIAGSTRKGGRNQANALSTDPMPYAEALSISRQNNSIAHRRAQKPAERYHDQFYPPSNIAVSPYISAQPMGIPLSAPAHFTSPPFLSTGHHMTEQTSYNSESARRPPFKHMQSAPGGLYTLHSGGDGYSGSWPQSGAPPPYTSLPPQDAFHPPGQDVTNDSTNAFWKLSVTSPPATESSLPPPARLQSQWLPNANSNYTHERPTLPSPHNALGDSQTFPVTPQYFAPAMSGPVGPVGFQNSSQGSSHSSQPHEEHCENTSHWPRSTASGYRSSGSN